ncbi:CaiB/BaiF CoA transferase family protein [Salinibacillus xinjiangensis]|uniref:CoA transferase n=1 Tax=Salinibacillus xinjiangensis TaxID=1229268 RepID=A0A6G1X1W0_9BACI|nr:CoA transferase [Salinibacillus xinjiangensis]MRG84875.1 CoA transferase [Salinibacillus xinjiangensis]
MLNKEILENIRIIDLGTVIAGPQCAGLLGDFGAEVIKVERPKNGDPARRLAPMKDGASLWWKVMNRNKKSITLNLKSKKGNELMRKLVEQSDVLIENFRPGVLEKLGLSWEQLQAINPNLILLRISGYGQTGPKASLPSFGRAAEAYSGVQYITGFPDGPPVHAGFSMADSVTALMGAYGVSLALYERQFNNKGGQVIDLALFESLFRLVEFPVAMYDQLNKIQERKGNQHPGSQPINTYKTKDNQWITISAATDQTAKRFLKAIGGDELANDPRFITNEKRVENIEVLDRIIKKWMLNRTFSEIEKLLHENDAAFYSKVMNMQDLFESDHIRAREGIVSVEDDDFDELKMQGVVPKFSRTAGKVKHTGPKLGEHNLEVYSKLCGIDKDELSKLKDENVI